MRFQPFREITPKRGLIGNRRLAIVHDRLYPVTVLVTEMRQGLYLESPPSRRRARHYVFAVQAAADAPPFFHLGNGILGQHRSIGQLLLAAFHQCLGKGMREGAEAVFKSVNGAGGVHGRQIRLVVGDDGYEPERAIDETLKMIEQQKVFSLFGYVGTPTANAVLPIVKEMNVPLVGAFTGAMSLRQPLTEQVFNVRASYDDEAETLVAHFLAKGAKSVAVFYQDDGSSDIDINFPKISCADSAIPT